MFDNNVIKHKFNTFLIYNINSTDNIANFGWNPGNDDAFEINTQKKLPICIGSSFLA